LDKDTDVQSARQTTHKQITQIQLQDNQPSSTFLTFQKRERERSQREVSLKKVWIIIASKYCMLLLFSVTAHFPVQDVSAGAQTHLGAAQTHTVLDPCYAGFNGHLAQNMHSKTQKCVWASSIRPRADHEQKKQRFCAACNKDP
jgi:hypothetical protein